MKFDHFRDDCAKVLGLDIAEWFFASGDITPGDAECLNDLLNASNALTGGVVFIDSLGGDVLEAIRLGRIIRGRRLNTAIGSRGSADEFGFPTIGQAVCASAACLVFLGGVYRQISNSSDYMVHQFSFVSPTPQDGQTAQVLAAIIIEYIREMGADPKLFSLMADAAPNEVRPVLAHELQEYNIVTPNAKSTWYFEMGNGMPYLKGVCKDIRGEHKLIFMAANANSVVLGAWVNVPDTNDSNLHASWCNQLCLFVDKESIYIDNEDIAIPKARVNNWIMCSFSIHRETALKLIDAESIGFGFVPPSKAIFIGFTMNMTSGREKLRKFLWEILPAVDE